MKQKKASVEARLLRSMDEALTIHRGEVTAATEYSLPMTARRAVVAEPEPIGAREIVALRKSLGDWSQAVLAMALDVSLGTVRNWEQGVSAPTGPARRLLAIARERPDVLQSLVVSRDQVRTQRPGSATKRRGVTAKPGRKRKSR